MEKHRQKKGNHAAIEVVLHFQLMWGIFFEYSHTSNSIAKIFHKVKLKCAYKTHRLSKETQLAKGFDDTFTSKNMNKHKNDIRSDPFSKAKEVNLFSHHKTIQTW